MIQQKQKEAKEAEERLKKTNEKLAEL
jgi:hypothetical protein